ncbi:hypothetical protein HYV81_06190 [Candidatus Woesearchaeota archaeon]|nr:hypothetical protein [Candidatus Woesearchaeota archaeon]
MTEIYGDDNPQNQKGIAVARLKYPVEITCQVGKKEEIPHFKTHKEFADYLRNASGEAPHAPFVLMQGIYKNPTIFVFPQGGIMAHVLNKISDLPFRQNIIHLGVIEGTHPNPSQSPRFTLSLSPRDAVAEFLGGPKVVGIGHIELVDIYSSLGGVEYRLHMERT